MRKTIEYLDAAKKALNIESDYKMAKWLDISGAALSQYQNGKRIIDNYAASRIAQALGIDPIEVIAAANWEREKDEKRRAYWESFSKKCAAAVLIMGISSFAINNLEADIKDATMITGNSIHPSCKGQGRCFDAHDDATANQEGGRIADQSEGQEGQSPKPTQD